MESPTTTSRSFLDRYNILLKLHYFLYFSSFGALYPIINITLRGRGLSDTELLYINIIVPFLVFLTNPLFGFIADHSRKYKLTFCVVVTLCTILFGTLFLLPSMKTQHIQGELNRDVNSNFELGFCASQEVATKCSSRSACGCSYRANCSTMDTLNSNKHFSFSFAMNSKNIHPQREDHAPAVCGIHYHVPVTTEVRKSFNKTSLRTLDRSQPIICQISCSISHFCHGRRYDDQIRYLIFYAILFILGNNFLSNGVALGASIGFAALSRPELFGNQRIFGTVAFGIIAFLASRIYQMFKSDLVYMIIFSISTISCMIVTCFIRIHTKKKPELNESSQEKDAAKSQSRLAALMPLFGNVDILVFLALTTVWGMSYAGLDPYLYLYLDEFATCKSHDIIGWMSLTSAISEILGLFSAAPMITFLGTNLTSIIILLAFALRFAGYYIVPDPYLIIIMETMHFFNFGVLYVLIVQKANSIAPPGLAGTLQGVGLGMSFGLGRGIGLLIASFIYTSIEKRSLFLIISIFNLIAAVIFSLYFLITGQLLPKKTKDPKIIIVEDGTNNKTEPLLETESKTPIEK